MVCFTEKELNYFAIPTALPSLFLLRRKAVGFSTCSVHPFKLGADCLAKFWWTRGAGISARVVVYVVNFRVSKYLFWSEDLQLSHSLDWSLYFGCRLIWWNRTESLICCLLLSSAFSFWRSFSALKFRLLSCQTKFDSSYNSIDLSFIPSTTAPWSYLTTTLDSWGWGSKDQAPVG